MKTRIGIYGYGNLGHGVERAVLKNDDMELIGIFSKRPPEDVHSPFGTKVFPAKDAALFTDKIDVMILCGGSATDLPVQTPALAKLFNVVDSFDTHADIPLHWEEVNQAAKESGHIAVISCGWDPGLFSLARVYFQSVLPDGADYTFWGKGVSQGHSDAVRRIEGVSDARQYTVPVESALESVRRGENPSLSTRQKHTRECYVVAKDGADLARIEKEIKDMPNYFSDYDTTVHFISQDEMKKNHSTLPHGGFVLRSGKTSEENSHILELHLKLDSNPEFTGSILTAVARAANRMKSEGFTGCKTMPDLPPSYLSPLSAEELRAHLI